MRRRSYLALTATALSTGVAGCMSNSNDSESGTPSTRTTGETTDEPTDETTPTHDPTTTEVSVSVENIRLQSGVVTIHTDYVTVDSNGQYLLVDVSVEDGVAERTQFTVNLAGETYTPMSEENTPSLWHGSNNAGYQPAVGGLLVFKLPEKTVATSPEAKLTLPDGVRQLSTEVQKRLAAGPPSLSMDVTMQSTIPVGESPTIEMSVTNHGTLPARFVAGLNRTGPRTASIPLKNFSIPVPAGETRTTTFVDSTVSGYGIEDKNVGDNDRDVIYTLYTLDGSSSQDVEYVPASN